MSDDKAFSMKAAASMLAKSSTAAGRRDTEKRIAKSTDGRSLRATGRTAQLNFRIREDLKDAVLRAAETEGVAFAAWMERVLEAAVKQGKRDA